MTASTSPWAGLVFSSKGDNSRSKTVEVAASSWSALRQTRLHTVKVKSLSRVRLVATLWTVALQAPPSTGFSRQEYWSGLPFSSIGDLPNPGIEPRSPSLQVDSLPTEPQGKPKNTGVGSLSLLQRIFLTQELNHSLLNCRQILYQLSYQGSPVGKGWRFPGFGPRPTPWSFDSALELSRHLWVCHFTCCFGIKV